MIKQPPKYDYFLYNLSMPARLKSKKQLTPNIFFKWNIFLVGPISNTVAGLESVLRGKGRGGEIAGAIFSSSFYFSIICISLMKARETLSILPFE